MVNKVFCESGNSRDCKKYFRDNIHELGTIKEISCAFDTSNFIFFEGSAENRGYHFIVKTYTGRMMFLRGINCGYGGEGPRSYQEILEYLEIDPQIAEKIAHSNASKVYFDTNGKYIKWEYPDYFFDSRSRKGKIEEKYYDVNLAMRKVYLYNPERYLEEIIPLLIHLNPYRLEYWIGVNSELDDSFRFKQLNNLFNTRFDDHLVEYITKPKTREEWRRRKKNKYARASEVSFILSGEKYDVLLLVPLELQMSMIEFLLLFFTGESFIMKKYDEVSNFFPKKNWIERLLFSKNKKQAIYGQINLGRQGYE